MLYFHALYHYRDIIDKMNGVSGPIGHAGPGQPMLMRNPFSGNLAPGAASIA